MRVGIVGAGAVGGAIAALLERAGHEVEVTARGDHLAAIREHGIHLTGAWGEHVARVDAGEELTRTPELAIVATKAQDAQDAIKRNARLLDGVPVMIVQNGLDSIATASPLLPRSDVVGALAMFATSLVSPGTIAITTAGPTYVGSGSGDHDVPARYVARVLDEAMPTRVLTNFVGAQWTKLVVNQLNALPAITGLSAQAVIADRGLRLIMTASMRETVRIALASGVRFESLQGLSHRRLALFARVPLWGGQVIPLLMKLRLGATPNPGSTLQSIRRGQSTEIDYLNGAVVRAAAAAGRSAPVNEALVELVHEVEHTHTFLAAAEVVLRVRSRPVRSR